MSPSDARAQREQATLLLRLRQLRQQQAEAQLRREREAHARALAAVRAGQARVDGERTAQRRLLQALGEHPGLPRVARWAEARREAVAEQLERAEYALIDDEEALHDADRALGHAGQALRQAQARCEAAAQALQRAQAGHRHACEQQAEREEPPRARPAGAP